ncbi:dickkopf-like protein 1 [Rhinatrema bivittatum]|uniref:dickkopf-like protein 1 n=1 Tax=Rhinatrema bivittatum TaxID=194408 RepID=UPI001126082C|nr:dickkopf-like protein 1 [Rhinatrema bivittatum]XP_029441601.1 dickkopf-like protein 1 [Rhinatrema bivittatum]
MLPLPLLGLLLLRPLLSSPALLSPRIREMESLFRDLGQLLEGGPEEPSTNMDIFDDSVDFRQLPPNYHNEEQKEKRLGNATIYSRRKIDKVTNNQTGETVISQKTFTSIEKGDRGLMDEWKKSPERERNRSTKLQALRRPLKSLQGPFHPRLAFVMMRIPRTTTRAKLPSPDMFSELKRVLQRQSMGAAPSQQMVATQSPARFEDQRRWPSFLCLLRKLFSFQS